jgi:hypothetical protein
MINIRVVMSRERRKKSHHRKQRIDAKPCQPKASTRFTATVHCVYNVVLCRSAFGYYKTPTWHEKSSSQARRTISAWSRFEILTRAVTKAQTCVVVSSPSRDHPLGCSAVAAGSQQGIEGRLHQRLQRARTRLRPRSNSFDQHGCGGKRSGLAYRWARSQDPVIGRSVGPCCLLGAQVPSL